MQFNLFKEDIPFTKWVSSCCDDYYDKRNIEAECYVDRGWCVTQHGGEVSPANYMHSHANHPLVAVFYLNTIEEHPPIHVCDQVDGRFLVSKQEVIPDSDVVTLRFKTVKIPALVNTLVLFPGYCLHGVGANTTNVPRVSIPMNIGIR
jgi:hypothetical protein